LTSYSPVQPHIHLFSIAHRHYCSRSIALISETFESYHHTSPNFITIYISPHILLQKKGLPASHYFSIIVGFILTIVYHRPLQINHWQLLSIKT
jgi:hypothetical protein